MGKILFGNPRAGNVFKLEMIHSTGEITVVIEGAGHSKTVTCSDPPCHEVLHLAADTHGQPISFSVFEGDQPQGKLLGHLELRVDHADALDLTRELNW